MNIWTERDDERLTRMVLVFVSCGLRQKDAFVAAAYELKRSVGSCDFRFNLLRPSVESELEKAKIKGKRARKYGVNIRELLNGLVG